MAFNKDKNGSDSVGPGLNLIGRGTSITGTITSASSVRIEGEVKGQVNCQDLVTVGATGSVEGDINAKNAVIGGVVAGNLTIQEKLVLEAKCSVSGDIKARRLVIDEGAVFDGQCLMNDQTMMLASKAANS